MSIEAKLQRSRSLLCPPPVPRHSARGDPRTYDRWDPDTSVEDVLAPAPHPPLPAQEAPLAVVQFAQACMPPAFGLRPAVPIPSKAGCTVRRLLSGVGVAGHVMVRSDKRVAITVMESLHGDLLAAMRLGLDDWVSHWLAELPRSLTV